MEAAYSQMETQVTLGGKALGRWTQRATVLISGGSANCWFLTLIMGLRNCLNITPPPHTYFTLPVLGLYTKYCQSNHIIELRQ